MAKKQYVNKAEDRAIRSLDKLAQYERYQEEILPILTKAVSEGWSPEKIRSHPKLAAMMAARMVTIAITDPDSSKALAAGKDQVDRIEGKAKERVENTHKLEKLPDEQLDAMLLSKLASASTQPEDSDDEVH